MIPVLRPTVDEQTKKELLDVLDSGWWGQASKTAELEEKFAKKIGVKYAVATSSCTAALDLCLKAHDLDFSQTRDRNKFNVVTTPMTFVADAAVNEWNGMETIFGDVEVDTLNLDPKTLPINAKTKALIVVNSHGRIANIREVRKRYKGLIIEDAAHSFYSKGAGKQGDIAVWSFQAVKTCPAGDGGMITTNDKKIAQKIKNMTWLGVEKSTYNRAKGGKYSWDYDILHNGTKSYMNDINAILVLGNMRRIDSLISKRLTIQAKYNKALGNLKNVTLLKDSPTVQYYTLRVKNRDKVSDHLSKNEIVTSVHFKPLSEMTYWKKANKVPLPVTNMVWKELLSLPCHDALSTDQQDYIIKKFKEVVQ